MRAAIFNPYLDTLGGGERYTMAIAKVLADQNYKVDIQWKDSSIAKKLEDRFGIDLTGVNFIRDVKRGDGYDVLFWISDGSIPNLLSRKNFLHFQVPFTGVSGKSLINKFKLMRINRVIVNSNFTKEVIDKEFNINSFVLYPPVSVTEFKPKKKENIILGVGRFSNLLQSKRQDVLVKTFASFHKSNEDYRLILAGGVEVGADEIIKKLEKEINGLPVEIIKSPNFKTIKDLYGKAKIFWSASGFAVDEINNPKAVEHFGITVVEAMAAGAVPIIYNGGGHKEIIDNSENGFLWKDTSEMYRYTKELCSDEKLRRKMATSAISRSKKFSYEVFKEKFTGLI